MPDQSPRERTCPVCGQLVAAKPYVRQQIMDLEGKWVRPHYQLYHLACHLLVARQPAPAAVAL